MQSVHQRENAKIYFFNCKIEVPSPDNKVLLHTVRAVGKYKNNKKMRGCKKNQLKKKYIQVQLMSLTYIL